MLKMWSWLRIVVVIAMIGTWLGVIIPIINGWIPVRTNEADGSHFYWSLVILFVLIILVILHIFFQWIGRHLEYIAFLFTITLLVSSVTLLTSLGIATTTGEPIQTWVIPITVLGVSALIVMVLGQAIALRISRDEYRRQIENIIWDSDTQNISVEQKRALVGICKRIIPIDFYPNDLLGTFSYYPEIWNEMRSLLTQFGINWKDEYYKLVRGCDIPKIKFAENFYNYLGLMGCWVGSIIMVIGTVALNSKSI
jgi:hypothetical protein